MKLKQLHTILLLTLCAALAACSESNLDFNEDLHNGKTPIEVSVGGVDASAVTRAVITDGTGHHMSNFDVNTKIFMIIKSEYQPFESPNEALNYGGSNNTKYTVTRGEVVKDQTDVSFGDASGKRIRYWDDAHARSSQLTIWAYAQKGQSWTNCTFEIPNGNSTDQLNQYVDQEYTDAKGYQNWTENEIYPAIRHWRASHHQNDDNQDGTSIQCQDLLFSNNIANYNSGSVTNKDYRLKFDPASKRFPQNGNADMKFYHAMSKITIHIKKGSGFSDVFNFTGSGNITLKGFNKKGLFHIGDGQFEYIWKHKPNSYTDEENEANAFIIPQIYNWTTPATGDAMTLEALVIPNIHEFLYSKNASQSDTHSRFDKGATDVMMEFTINNNKYQLTSGQLFNALHEDGDPTKGLVTNASTLTGNNDVIPLEAGKHYVFTFKVGKTKIEKITAQVADWEEVKAELTPSNARIKLQLEERGGAPAATDEVAIYRAADDASEIKDDHESYEWTTGYVDNKNEFKKENEAWKLTNAWYWSNSQNYYHFRAIIPSTTSVLTQNKADNTTPDYDYVTLTSGQTYTDIRWGAPMRDNADDEAVGDFKWTYNVDNGFGVNNTALDNKNQIYQAIGPTENAIKLTLFHMMSDLTFNIKTTEGDDKVELKKTTEGDNPVTAYTKLELVGFYPGGQLLLGTGLVKTTGNSTETKDVTWKSENNGTHVYQYGAVPQPLASVQLYITTPDNNEYILDLKDVKVAADKITSANIANPYTKVGGTGDDKDKYTISRWYPGFKYTYNITLKKTGIKDIQATIVNWETVTADETVTIK